MQLPQNDVRLYKKACSTLVEKLKEYAAPPFQIYVNRASVGMLVPVASEGTSASAPPIWYRDVHSKLKRTRISWVQELLQTCPPHAVWTPDQNPGLDVSKALHSTDIFVVPLRYTPPGGTVQAVGIICANHPGVLRDQSAESLVSALEPELTTCAAHIAETASRHDTYNYRKTMVRVVELAGFVIQRERVRIERNDRVDQRSWEVGVERKIRKSTRRLGRVVARELTRFFKLSRCALLIPSDEDPASWGVVAQVGLLPEQCSALYHRDLGLTGRTLSCATPALVVVSSSVEDDPRWSKRYGTTFLRNATERSSATPIAFIGVPFFSRMREGGNLPYGAILAMRPHDPVYGYPGPFSGVERKALQLVATTVAHGFDTLRWRRSLIDAASWQLEITNLLSSDRPDTNVYRGLLKILYRSMLPSRLVIAVRDSDREQITGREVFGGFQLGLAKDTVRRIYPDEPPKADQEDILARICRLRIQDPFVVDKTNTEWSCFLNEETRVRYGVDQPLTLIPILDRDRFVQAVILAESLPASSPISNDQLDDLRRFAQHAATVIEFVRLDYENRRKRRLIESMRLLTGQLLLPHADDVSLLRQIVSAICSEFSFSQAVFYRFDEDSGLLEGVFGLGVDGNEVRKTVYPVRSTPGVKRRASLAVHAFELKIPVFVDAMSDTLVDSEDRDRVGIDIACAGYAVPLLQGQSLMGVMILCWKPLAKPTPPLTPSCTHTLIVLGNFLALMLGIQRRLRELMTPRRAGRAKDLILEQVARLAARLQSPSAGRLPDTVPHISDDVIQGMLDAIIHEVASVFQAEVAGMFLADKPVIVDAGAISDSDSRHLWNSQFAGAEFRLCAAVGYTKDAVASTHNSNGLTYKPSDLGLTSLVLRTIRPRLSEDVANDPHWSKRAENLLEGSGERSLRTWLGVPLTFKENEKVYVFGALTCTRYRTFMLDSREFTSDDASVAQSIANLISLALYSRELVRNERTAFDRFLSLFRHDDLFSVVEEGKDYAERIKSLANMLAMDLTQDFPYPAGERLHEICGDADAICRSVRLAGLITQAYSAYAQRGTGHVLWGLARQMTISEVLDDVGAYCMAIAIPRGIHIAMEYEGEKNHYVKHRIDEAKTAYVVYALVRNALRSIETSRQNDGRVEIIVRQQSNTALAIRVRDNGVGLDGQDTAAIGKMFEHGFSTFRGSGMGLAIVQYLLDCHWATAIGAMLGSADYLKVKGVLGEWAEFEVLIPAQGQEGSSHEDCHYRG